MIISKHVTPTCQWRSMYNNSNPAAVTRCFTLWGQVNAKVTCNGGRDWRDLELSYAN